MQPFAREVAVEFLYKLRGYATSNVAQDLSLKAVQRRETELARRTVRLHCHLVEKLEMS
jgi:hypothetical protein